jgi:putative FmdB family regulatory protein
MPIYEYRCSECDHEFEELVSSSSSSVTCPKCATEKVNRKLSVFASSGSSSSFGGSCSTSGCGGGGGFS